MLVSEFLSGAFCLSRAGADCRNTAIPGTRIHYQTEWQRAWLFVDLWRCKRMYNIRLRVPRRIRKRWGFILHIQRLLLAMDRCDDPLDLAGLLWHHLTAWQVVLWDARSWLFSPSPDLQLYSWSAEKRFPMACMTGAGSSITTRGISRQAEMSLRPVLVDRFSAELSLDIGTAG